MNGSGQIFRSGSGSAEDQGERLGLALDGRGQMNARSRDDFFHPFSLIGNTGFLGCRSDMTRKIVVLKKEVGCGASSPCLP